MDAILKTIGTLVLGSIVIAIPILLPISFFCNWAGEIKLLLIIWTFVVWYFVCWSIADLSD